MRSILRLAVLVGMLAALGVAPAQAQTPDQSQTSTSGSRLVVGSGLGMTQSVAQTFTAGLTGTLDRVDLYLLQEAGAGSDVTVQIRTVVGGVPSNVVLATTTIPAASVPPFPGAFVTATFAAPANVVAGTQYAIVAYATSGTYGWETAPPGPDAYPGGSPFRSPATPPGAWLPSAIGDLAFRTFVTVAAYRALFSVERLAVSGRTLRFRMIGAAKVRFTLDRRIAPKRYRRVGSFVRKAKRGRNRVRIPARLNGKPVKKGVYRLSARSVGGGVPSGPLERRIVRLR